MDYYEAGNSLIPTGIRPAFEEILSGLKERLEKAGLMMHGRTIVDATIIESTSSTKNDKKEREPEMHQTGKKNQWHHGMKVHIGVDAGSGYVNTLVGTATNVHDVVETHALNRDDDHVVYGDSGYLGVEKREEILGNEHLSLIDWIICRRHSSLNIRTDYMGFNWEKYIKRQKASVRCTVEHAFLIYSGQC